MTDKILIIGASGFLGSHLYRNALKNKVDVVGTQSSKDYSHLIKFNLADDNLFDVLPAGWLVPDRTAVVICAAVTPMDRYVTDKENTKYLMVDRMKSLCRRFLDKGIKITFISTSYVFSGEDGYYTETDQSAPCNEYGRQKLAMENYLTGNSASSLIFRLDKIVGDDAEENHIFSEWTDAIKNNRPIVCIKDQIISPTHVDDISLAILKGIELNLSGIFHLANSESFLRSELARQFLRITSQKHQVLSKTGAEIGLKDARPLKSSLDSSRFRAATAFQFTSMRNVIDNYINNCKQKKGK